MKQRKIISDVCNKENKCVMLTPKGVIIKIDDVGGIYAAQKLWKLHENELKNSFVAINVLSKPAAAILLKGGVRSIYAYRASKYAEKLVRDHNIEFEYGKIIEYIFNSDKTDICPYEKMVLEINDVNLIVEAVFRELKD